MWVTSTAELPCGALNRIAATSGGLLGLLLLAGASGHLIGVWPTIMVPQSPHVFFLLFPGLVLAITALVNLLMCYPLWLGEPWANRLALIINTAAALYFAYLLPRGIPGHPIGLFLALVASQTIVLGALSAGLVWPVVSQR